MHPLVSIIVRSMDRPILHEALAAIASQSYRSIEVLVVDATGGRHAPVPPRCGPFPLRFIGGVEPRSRPIAANAGLDAARGDYIGLLDEDDLVKSAHVDGLVGALESRRDCVVAYSLGREIDSRGEVVRRRDTPYSRLLLFHDCFVMPSAVLFRCGVRDTCRFDERFDVCEDWDFWLQLSRLSDFLLVRQDTAIYRSDLGQSGMGRGENRDLEKFFRYRDLITAKWREEGERVAAAALPRLQDEFELARAELARGERKAAAARAGAIVAEYPHHVGALTVLGTVAALCGDFRTAAVHFQWAVNVDASDPGTQFNLAQVQERLGLLGDACSSYERVIELQPEHRHAHNRLAVLRRARNEG